MKYDISEAAQDACNPNPCNNGGTCIVCMDACPEPFSCTCPPEFSTTPVCTAEDTS